MKFGVQNASTRKISSIFVCLSILTILFLVGCKSKPANSTFLDYKSWKHAELHKLAQSRVCDIKGDDLKKINDYFLSAKVSDINIEDTDKYLYRIHIETESGNKNLDQYWEIYGVDGKYYIKDYEGKISESEREFIELLNQLYSK